MDSSSVELKVMYSQDLKAFNFFQKLCVYVLVSIVNDDPAKELKQKQQQRTPTDKEGDGNPEWNHEMLFDLNEVTFQDCDHLFIHFDLRHEGSYFGDKTIGEVRVPLKDLMDETNGIVRFVSYEVRTTDGKPNGVLNFHYKVNGKVKGMTTNSPTSTITGYPISHHHHQIQSPQIQDPGLEVQSSSPKVRYPSLDLEDISQETYPELQVHYPSHETQYSPQGNSYPPPDVYYPPPPLPPPPLPPPMADGAFYHPPHPPVLHPWSPTAGKSHKFGNGETWPNYFRSRRDLHSSFWNGR